MLGKLDFKFCRRLKDQSIIRFPKFQKSVLQSGIDFQRDYRYRQSSTYRGSEGDIHSLYCATILKHQRRKGNNVRSYISEKFIWDKGQVLRIFQRRNFSAQVKLMYNCYQTFMCLWNIAMGSEFKRYQIRYLNAFVSTKWKPLIQNELLRWVKWAKILVFLGVHYLQVP